MEDHLPLSLKLFALDQRENPEGPPGYFQPPSPSGPSPATQAPWEAVPAQRTLAS